MFTDGSTDCAQADLWSQHIQTPLHTLVSPVTGIKTLEKCRNRSIFKRDWSLVLFLIFLKAQATIGWIFTGKLCLCSPPRICLGIIVLFFILSQIPSELHPCYLCSFLPIYPKIFIFWPWADCPWIKSSSLHLIYFLRFAIKELEQILKICILYFYDFELKDIVVSFYQNQIIAAWLKPSWKIKIQTAKWASIVTQVTKPERQTSYLAWSKISNHSVHSVSACNYGSEELHTSLSFLHSLFFNAGLLQWHFH